MLFSRCHCSHNHNCGIVVPPADIPNHYLIDASVPVFQVTSVNIYVLLIIFFCVCYSYASNEYIVFSFLLQNAIKQFRSDVFFLWSPWRVIIFRNLMTFFQTADAISTVALQLFFYIIP